MVEQQPIQVVDGGSIPTPSLQNLWLEPCTPKVANGFVEQYHYTHSVKGMTPTHAYRILDKQSGQIVGAAIFGIPGQKQTRDRYNWILSVDGQKKIISLVELRRLVLLDEAPKNSESVVLSILFRLLRKAGVDRILSYADPNEKRTDHPDGAHTGLIYRAAGFHKIKSAGRTKAIWWGGRRYPIRNWDQYNNYHSLDAVEKALARHNLTWAVIPDQKKILRHEVYRGQLRPVWVPKIALERIGINKQLHEAFDRGEAKFVEELGKIGYIKDLRKGMPYFETPTYKTR